MKPFAPLLAFIALLLAAPVQAASVSTFTLSGWTAQAGQSERFTITRTGIGGQSVTFRTADGVGGLGAKAGADYTAVAKTIQFGPYQKSAVVQVPTTVDQSALGKTLSFGATITVKGAVVASASAAIVEPPAPAPLPPPDDILSPALSGVADIPSGFTPDTVPAPIPQSSAPDVVGAFRFICGAGQLLPDDPIVFPGQPGASHLHQFYGNTSANASSTYQSLRTSGESTCNYGAFPGNRSAYWQPAMLDGKGHVVKPDFVAIYYKRRPASDPIVSDPANPQYEGHALPLPNGLRFIFGFDMVTLKPATGGMYFNCQGPGSVPGHYATIPELVGKCPAGAQLGFVISAPECWDGKRLDSANHRDHVAYPGYGDWGYLKCPLGYPYVIPTFTLGAWYTVGAGDDLSLWQFSSDAMHPEKPHGSTGHADWFGAWDNGILNEWTGNCINKMLNCSAGNLGDGNQLKNASQPIYDGVPLWTNPDRLVPVP